MSKTSNTIIARAVLSRLNSGTSSAEISASLAAYLVEEKLSGNIGAITREIERQLLQDKNILYVHVTTAREIDQNLRSQIIDIFKKSSNAKDVVLEQTINPDVIGGVRCETAEEQLDLTVRRQLQRLKGLTTHRSMEK
jgi:F0F1-type ATP synthase delta subunit